MEQKSNQRSQNPLGFEKISSLLGKFAVPSIIAMLVSSFYNVVDQIFIGHSDAGYLGNAATNVSFPITTICLAITLTIAIGCATRFSLCLGRGQEDDAAKVVGSGFAMMVTFGIAYFVIIELFIDKLLVLFGATQDIFSYALTYTRITALGMPLLIVKNGMSNLARADGSPMYSMVCMLIGAVLNTILDPIFIFVFKWGIAGAAWATVIGQAASCAYALLYMGKFERVTLKKEYFRLNIKEIAVTAKMGMSQGLTQMAFTFVQIVLNRSLVFYGAQTEFGSEIPLAVNGIVMKVAQIVLAIVIGINQGMQPIVGFNYGAKKYQRVKSVYFFAVKIELVITCIALIVFEFFPKYVMNIFGSGNEQYMKFSVYFMRIFLIMLPLNGIQMISSNFFAAIGKSVKGAVLSLTRTVLFFIPLIFIMSHIFGLNGIIFAAPIADFIAFTVVLLFIIKELNSMHELKSMHSAVSDN